MSWWARAAEMLAASVLPIRAAHVSALHSLPEIHKDPFDRILIAQAQAEGLPLVTGDSAGRRYTVNTLW